MRKVIVEYTINGKGTITIVEHIILIAALDINTKKTLKYIATGYGETGKVTLPKSYRYSAEYSEHDLPDKYYVYVQIMVYVSELGKFITAEHYEIVEKVEYVEKAQYIPIKVKFSLDLGKATLIYEKKPI